MKCFTTKCKKALSLALCIALCFNMSAPVMATEDAGMEDGIVASGACGDNLTWKLDDNGILTISGTGDMKNRPWYDYRDEICGVIIENGVTSIGSSAFSECFGLSFIDIPSSVTSIGSCAFLGCPYLSEIYIKEGVTNIGGWAFYCCSSLGYLSLPKSITSIGDSAFYGCSNLNTVNYGGTEAEWNEIQIGEDNKYLLNSNIVCVQVKVVASGYCGENSTWELNSEGVLTISGTGNMNSYSPILGPKSPWYDYRQSIKDVIISSGVTSVGEGSFYNCNSLTNITIPETVTRIGYYAFLECSSLKSITIPSNVTSIGIATFQGCSSVTSVIIPEAVNSIEVGAFEACSALTSITLPESIVRIENSAFKGCSSLSTVNYSGSKSEWDVIDIFPNNECLLGAKIVCGKKYNIASGNCGDNLTWKLEDDGTLTISGTGDMEDYDSGTAPWYVYGAEIKKVDIGSSVRSIGDYAFQGLNLTSVTLPSGVTGIGNGAFEACSLLTNITIPPSVTSIGDSAFAGCALTSITIPEGITRIGNLTFVGCAFTSVIIPEGVTSIGEAAFQSCHYLTSITIPKSVTSFEKSSFSSCDQLEMVNYCGTMSEWVAITTGEYNEALHGATINFKSASGDNLTWKLDSEGILTIGGNGDITDRSFMEYATKIKAVIIGSGVTGIGDYAFCDYYCLTSVTIPSSVTSIGNGAFQGCTALTNITIPSSVTSIGDDAFVGCAFTSIIIPVGVTRIGNGTFYACALTSITIPEDVTSIGNYAFGSCSSLTSITIPEGVTSIGSSAFYNCSSLTSVTIPEGITSIEGSAFYGCSSLTSVTIPEGVTSIGKDAFYNCGLETVYYTGTEAEWNAITIGTNNDPLLNATIHYNVGAAAELPELEVEQIGSITATVTAPEGGWKVGENTFKVEAEKACFVAVSYDGGKTFMRVPAIQDANGGCRFTAENMDASTVVSVGYVGDVDGDGIIRARDARLALQAASGMEELSGLGHLAADLDNDGIIRAREARLMLQAASEMYTLEW